MEYMGKGSLTGIVGTDVKFSEPCIAYVCKGILRRWPACTPTTASTAVGVATCRHL